MKYSFFVMHIHHWVFTTTWRLCYLYLLLWPRQSSLWHLDPSRAMTGWFLTYARVDVFCFFFVFFYYHLECLYFHFIKYICANVSLFAWTSLKPVLKCVAPPSLPPCVLCRAGVRALSPGAGERCRARRAAAWSAGKHGPGALFTGWMCPLSELSD